MRPKASLTIFIFTWNRSRKLERALLSIEAVEKPRGLPFQVVVIDNDSSDDTAEVVESLKKRLPVTRWVEKRRGVSFSRQISIERCTSDYMLWLDDDSFLHKKALLAYWNAARKWPNATIFGGPLHILKSGKFHPEIAGLINSTAFFLGHKNWFSERPLTPDEDLFSANCLIRCSKIPDGLQFMHIGHSQTKRAFGEDSFFFRLLRNHGAEFVWVPSAICQQEWAVDELGFRQLFQNAVAKGIAFFRFNGALSSRRFPRMPNAVFVMIVVLRSMCEIGYSLLRRRPILAQVLAVIHVISRFIASVTPSERDIHARIKQGLKQEFRQKKAS